MGQDVFRRRRCRHDRDFAAFGGKAAQDVLLGAEIDRDHVMLGRRLLAVAFAQFPRGGVPGIRLLAGHVLGQVHAFQPGKGLGLFNQGRNVQGAVCFIGNDAVRRAAVADQAGQTPRIHTGHGRQVMGFQPGIQMLGRAPIGRIGDIDPHHRTPRRRRDGFHIFRVGAHVADMGEGEGDDLAGVGRIGDDFLIAGD